MIGEHYVGWKTVQEVINTTTGQQFIPELAELKLRLSDIQSIKNSQDSEILQPDKITALTFILASRDDYPGS